jgi:hypothetical protein
VKLPAPILTNKRKIAFARSILDECKLLRGKVSACRRAWDTKDFEYLCDAFQTLRELHERWLAAFSSFHSLVQPPFDDATPMERNEYQVSHVKWLSSELASWQSLLPAIRRFAKRKDPKSILHVQKLLRSVADLQKGLEELAKTANPILDLQMMEYLNYHSPVIVSTA